MNVKRKLHRNAFILSIYRYTHTALPSFRFVQNKIDTDTDTICLPLYFSILKSERNDNEICIEETVYISLTIQINNALTYPFNFALIYILAN